MNPNHRSSRRFSRALAAFLLAASAFLHAGLINAAGLGRLNVLSKLGQPFAAEIDLINISKEELASLKVNLASPAAHQAAGLRFDPVLNVLRLSVERRANGTPYIRANSHYRVAEPYLDLLIELNAQDGKFQRGYTALLDLPESVPAVAQAPAQGGAPAASVPASPPKAAVASAPSRPRVQASVPAPAPVAVAPVAPAVPKVLETAKVEAPKLEPPVAAPSVAEPVKPETKPETEEPAGAPEAVAEARAPTAPAPKVIVPPPPAPAPQPGLFDTLKNYLWPIVGLVLAGLGILWALRRRKPVSAPAAATVESVAASGGVPANFEAGAEAARTAPALASAVAPAVNQDQPTVASVTDMVDPMDEARVYLDHGRDEQAEKILREALNKEPGREDLQVMLLEILAGRGDKNGFNRLARSLHKQTGGQGDHWKRAMSMGYALDPAYALYSPTEAGALDITNRAAADLDIDLSSADAPSVSNHTVDILLSDGGGNDDMDKTMVLTRAGGGASPSTTPAPAIKPLPDMNFELPLASKPHPYDVTGIAPVAPTPEPAASDSKLDFEIDFSGVGKPWDDAPVQPPAVPVSNDAQRESMQQKLDLASAYKEMGDKEAALELLHEVERDGDATHQAEARKIIQALA